MKTLASLSLAAVVIATGASAQDARQSSRSFYDRNGSFAGSSVTRGSTSVYDARGSFAGSTFRNSNGTTSFFNGRGSFVGSSVNTGRR